MKRLSRLMPALNESLGRGALTFSLAAIVSLIVALGSGVRGAGPGPQAAVRKAGNVRGPTRAHDPGVIAVEAVTPVAPGRATTTRPSEPPLGRVRLFGSDQFRAGQPFVAAAISPDARRVASVHSDGLVCLWDAETGKRLASAQGPLLPGDIAFMPDGKRLVTCAFGTIEYRSLPDLTLTRTDHVEGNICSVWPSHPMAVGSPAEAVDLRLRGMGRDRRPAVARAGDQRVEHRQPRLFCRWQIGAVGGVGFGRANLGHPKRQATPGDQRRLRSPRVVGFGLARR